MREQGCRLRTEPLHNLIFNSRAACLLYCKYTLVIRSTQAHVSCVSAVGVCTICALHGACTQWTLRATADTHHRSEWRTPPLSLLSTVQANAEHSLGPRQCETESPKGVETKCVDGTALWQLKEHCTAIRQRRDGRKIVPWYRCRDDRLPQKAANSSATAGILGEEGRPWKAEIVANEILATYAWQAHLNERSRKDPGPIAVVICGSSVRIHTRFTPPEFVR